MKKSFVAENLRDLADAVEKLNRLGINITAIFNEGFLPIKKRKYTKRKPFNGKRSALAGYKYKKGTHWTQKAANKAKVKRVLRDAHKALVAQKGK